MRIALGVEYDGSNFCGWQRQSDNVSIQAVLEQAIEKIADHRVNIYCAGRTDAGVHAMGQVIHFDTNAIRDLKAWVYGVNSNLPVDIGVTWVKSVSKSFHARFCATSRHYYYIIDNSPIRPSLFGRYTTYFPWPLDTQVMQRAAQVLLGDHDFTSFRAQGCQSISARRHLMYINVSRYKSYVVINLKANAFLYHMVRNIVGTLLEIGCGKKPETWMTTLLLLKDRRQASATAKAQGLYLIKVDYPNLFNLPVTPIKPFFIAN